MIDATTPVPMNPAMIASDTRLGTCRWSWAIILAPMRMSRIASAYLR